MTTIKQLKQSGKESAIWRGHKMTHYKKDGRLFESFCKVCHAMLWIIPEPAPNEIEISGSSVAVDCISK